MEKIIVENMKSNKEITSNFSNKELEEFLKILCSNESDTKRQENFIKFIKGEDK